MRISDWSSDVCSSDLPLGQRLACAKASDELRQRHHPIAARSQLREMRLELAEPDGGGGQVVFAKAMIHQQHGAAIDVDARMRVSGIGLLGGRRHGTGAAQPARKAARGPILHSYSQTPQTARPL